jgi:hypothetical protein
MITFDGTSREICLARRLRTNTPLQALTSLNDPVYVECARYFAKRMNSEKADIIGQIRKAYSLAMSKEISNDKLLILNNLYQKSLQDFKKKPKEAMLFLGYCEDNSIKPKNMPDLAAKTMVAMTIFNLDEFVMKE